jgi:histidinol-phosphate aminotransferase
MRVGLAFGQPGVIAEIAKVKDSYNVNRLSLCAAAAALDDYAWMQHNVVRVRETRAALSAGLGERGFVVLASEANFVLARKSGHDLGPLQRTLKDNGILVRHFATQDLKDALRITVGTPEEIELLFATLDRVQA